MELLTKLEFRKTADPALRKAAQRGHAGDFQKALLASHRSIRKRLEKELPDGEGAVLWSLSGDNLTATDRELSCLLAGSRKQRGAARKSAATAVFAGDHRPAHVLLAIDTLVRCGEGLKSQDYAALYCALSRIRTLDRAESEGDEQEQMIQTLLCEGELPLLLGLLSRDLKGRSASCKSASRVLREGLNAGTDTDGMLHGSLSDRADRWLAPFVRSALWSDAFGDSWMKAADTVRLADTTREVATQLIQTGLVSRPPSDLRHVSTTAAEVVERGTRATGIREASPFAVLARAYMASGGRRVGSKKRQRRIETSNQSDWAESAILRSGLSVDSDVCVLNWHTPVPQLHLAMLGTPLLSGSWSTEVTVGGKSLGPVGEWHCSCWFSDDEAAFVELEADPSESVHVVRHVLLSLKDHLAVVCESVTSADNAEVTVSSRLPLVADPLAVTNSITREIVLHADCLSARVVPAWLEDDRIQQAVGRCEKDGDALLCETSGPGGATMPLVLDWHPERQAHDADWNRLTVTESRRELTGQDAAGFRVRIGGRQIVVYRSLRSGAAPRAVLGLHTTNETVYGRMKKSGEIAALVHVEGEDL